MGRLELMKAVEAMTWEELESMNNMYKVNGNGGGMRVKDIQILHSVEDEMAWRREKGYVDLLPREIEIELLEQGKIQERYL
tara:strand:- start:282 stop:524 length:243 start_codon:yes stop_codon:yes gene_type:complete